MKKNILGAVLFFMLQLISAQNTPIVSNDNTVYNTSGIEVVPEFPGGMQKFYQFVGDTYNIPAEKDFLGGKIYATFVIEKDGSVADIKILKDVGFGTGEEAIRVLKLSPKWTPATQNGKTVRCSYSLPIVLPANYFEINEYVRYVNAEKDIEIAALPLNDYRLTVMVDYNSQVISSQHASLNNISLFEKEIASCRTFCFLHELEALYKADLIKGGDTAMVECMKTVSIMMPMCAALVRIGNRANSSRARRARCGVRSRGSPR